MNNIEQNRETSFYSKVASLLKEARKNVVKAVNKTMVYTYFEIGRMIVEEEQNGKNRADYGKQLIKGLSIRLTNDFGKGFSTTNLKQMRSFYLIYQKQQINPVNSKNTKGQTVSDEFNLSWSHYLKLMRINNEAERKYYQIEAYKNQRLKANS